MINIGLFLVVFGALVIIFPQIISFLVGFVLVAIGATIIAGHVTIKKKKNKIKFGDVVISYKDKNQ